MGDLVKMKLEGVEKLLKALEEVDKQAKKVLKEAGKAGGEVFREAAEANAPGPLVTVIEKSTQGNVEVAVGPSKAHWYYRFFETGARPHEIKARRADVLYIPGVGREFFTSASETGGVTAKPFLRPAFDTKHDAALKAFGETIWKALGRIK
jgi:HK97 gp10 family phage protein